MSTFVVTDEDREAWRALPFQGATACAGCGQQRTCAGRRSTGKRCLECFSRKRHRRIGQLKRQAS